MTLVLVTHDGVDRRELQEDALGFLRLVRFLPLRRRQARIVRGLRWFVALASSTATRVVRLCTCAPVPGSGHPSRRGSGDRGQEAAARPG